MLVPYCLSLSVYLLLYYLDLNVRDIEDLSSQEREFQEQIASLEESLKKFQDEERSFVNQAANLRKQMVGTENFVFLISL
jgi:cell division septum initiation protein DivIVA